MRLIIPFDNNGLAIAFENIQRINDDDKYITVLGDLTIVVNQYAVCNLDVCRIPKSWLLLADEVYLDTRIEEVKQ